MLEAQKCRGDSLLKQFEWKARAWRLFGCVAFKNFEEFIECLKRFFTLMLYLSKPRVVICHLRFTSFLRHRSAYFFVTFDTLHASIAWNTSLSLGSTNPTKTSSTPPRSNKADAFKMSRRSGKTR